MHTLNITTATGYEATIPFHLPDAIAFTCFLPGIGIASACLHPSAPETDARGTVAADISEIEAWRTKDEWRRDLKLNAEQNASLSEQAGDVLSRVLDPLNARFGSVERAQWASLPLAERRKQVAQSPAAVLMLIAEMAEAEVMAHEAWVVLPDAVRQSTAEPDGVVSSEALAAYVNALAEQAQLWSIGNAKRYEAAWMEAHGEEQAEARRAARTDAAIDRMKDGQS